MEIPDNKLDDEALDASVQRKRFEDKSFFQNEYNHRALSAMRNCITNDTWTRALVPWTRAEVIAMAHALNNQRDFMDKYVTTWLKLELRENVPDVEELKKRKEEKT